MIIIGLLMDDVSGMLLCTPLLLPLMTAIRVNPIHFASIIGLGMGNITPAITPLLYIGDQYISESDDKTDTDYAGWRMAAYDADYCLYPSGIPIPFQFVWLYINCQEAGRFNLESVGFLASLQKNFARTESFKIII